MKTTLLAAAIAMACSAAAIGQADPKKPWLKLLQDSATESSGEGVVLSRDGQTVFFVTTELDSSRRFPGGPTHLIRQRIGGARESVGVIPTNGLEVIHLWELGVSNDGSRLVGTLRTNSYSDERTFEFIEESGLSFGSTVSDYTLTVSRSGSASLWVELRIGPGFGYGYFERRAPNSIVALPDAMDDGYATWLKMDGDGDTVVGERHHPSYEEPTVAAIWRETEGVQVLDDPNLPPDSIALWVSENGETVAGVARLTEETAADLIRYGVFIWSESTGARLIPNLQVDLFFAFYMADDLKTIITQDPENQHWLFGHMSQIWRDGHGIAPMAHVLTDEYGLQIPSPHLRITSISADGQMISGFFFSDPDGGYLWPNHKPFVAHIPDPIPGDLTKDWEITGADLAVFLAAWGSDDPDADFDDDGLVASGDLAILLASWGR